MHQHAMESPIRIRRTNFTIGPALKIMSITLSPER
jgi:hypothetical protein